MSDSLTTHLDRPYAHQPEVRAAAIRVLQHHGGADLVEMLGLDQDPAEPADYLVVDGRLVCRVCRRKVRGDGVCRRLDCGGAR